jgi:hypothetical protein
MGPISKKCGFNWGYKRLDCMKILIYSEGRVGSHSLGRWLSQNLGMAFIAESMKFDYENNDDFIRKIYFIPKHISEANLQWMTEKEEVKFDNFDKVIRLYRKNTFEQSISYLHTLHSKKIQHSEGKFDAYYELNKEFCDKYYIDIYRTMNYSDMSNNELKTINQGLLISYEEIFVENTGQKLIEEYIGFKSQIDIYDSRNKLRIENKEMDRYLNGLIENYRQKLKLI